MYGYSRDVKIPVEISYRFFYVVILQGITSADPVDDAKKFQLFS